MGVFLAVFGLIFSIILIVYYCWIASLSVYVVSRIDNKPYLVRNLQDKQYTADTLAKIRRNIKDLIKKLLTSSPDKYQPYVQQLAKKIDHVIMTENINDFLYTSYSVNKGEQLVFCLRSRKDKDEIHDLNLMMYVVLHEISHIACPEYGHTEVFKEIFKHITETAISMKMYIPLDFKNHNEEYCGIEITDSIV